MAVCRSVCLFCWWWQIIRLKCNVIHTMLAFSICKIHVYFSFQFTWSGKLHFYRIIELLYYFTKVMTKFNAVITKFKYIKNIFLFIFFWTCLVTNTFTLIILLLFSFLLWKFRFLIVENYNFSFLRKPAFELLLVFFSNLLVHIINNFRKFSFKFLLTTLRYTFFIEVV